MIQQREYEIKKTKAWVIIEKTKTDKTTRISKHYYGNEDAAKMSLSYLKEAERRRQQHRDFKKSFFSNYETESEAMKEYRNYLLNKIHDGINER